MGKLAGKVAIVTGGSGGIGRGIATALTGEGARVCVADVDRARCEAAAAAIGGGAFGLALDVRSRESIEALVAGVVDSAGGVDVLVNCAGVFSFQMLAEIDEAEFDRVFSINVRGLLFMTQAAAGRMIEQGRGGAIINIASGAGRRGTAGGSVYSASKSAVISLTQSLAVELIPHRIRVNAIAPGAVRTAMWDEVNAAFGKFAGGQPDAAEAVLVSQTPIGRIAVPDDFGGAALFLASEDSAYVLGQTLNVDGGFFMS